MKIGLIGYGYWGKILLPKLENFGDVVFVCTSKDNYKERLKEVDWVVVATPMPNSLRHRKVLFRGWCKCFL